jgi:hypothetical protein
MKLISKKPVVKFKVGDLVTFNSSTLDKGAFSPWGTEYGVIIEMNARVNKQIVVVQTETEMWEGNINELTPYKDPFQWCRPEIDYLGRLRQFRIIN